MDKNKAEKSKRKSISKARERLTALEVKRITEPGIYHDGAGLYLQVSRATSRSKSWFLRYTIEGKVRDMGLGSLTEWSLAEARERAKLFRRMLDDKLDPIEVRNTGRETQKLSVAERAKELSLQKTFAQCARDCHAGLKSSWKNPKHADQWINSLSTYAFPVLGELNVIAVDKFNIKEALVPIWLEKEETASRVLQRIHTVLDWAVAHEFHPGYKSSLWKDLKVILPKRPKTQTKHFASCPFDKVSALLSQLPNTQVSPLLKLCFEFLVLTAGRSIEVRGALKSEIDVTKQLWRIDGSRMKTNITHTVPLSDRAMQIVQQAFALSPDSKFIFPSGRIQKPFSDQAFTKVILKENLQAPYTAHGFRSSFRMWAGKMTSYERVVCELCLAHDIKTEVEAAYDRNDYEDKRRHLMQDWANYLSVTQHDKVNAK